MAEAKVKSNGLIKLRASDEDIALVTNSFSSCGSTVTKSLNEILFAEARVRYRAEIRQFIGNAPLPEGWTKLDKVSYYNGYVKGASNLAVKITVKSVEGMTSKSNSSTISDNWSFNEKVRTVTASERTTWSGSISNIASAIKAEYDSTGLKQKILQALQKNPGVLSTTPEFADFYYKGIRQKFGSSASYTGRKRRFAAVAVELTSVLTISAQGNQTNQITKKGGQDGANEANSQIGMSIYKKIPQGLAPFSETGGGSPIPGFELEKSACGTWCFVGEEGGKGLVLMAKPSSSIIEEVLKQNDSENRKANEFWRRDQAYLEQQRVSGASDRTAREIVRHNLTGGGGGGGGAFLQKSGNAVYLGVGGNIGDTFVATGVKAPIYSADRTRYDIAATLGIVIGNDEAGRPIVKTVTFYAESRYIPTADDLVKAAVRNAPYLVEKLGQIVTNKNKSVPQKAQEARAAVTNALSTNAITPAQAAATNNYITNSVGTIVSDYNGATIGQQVGAMLNGTNSTIAPGFGSYGPGASTGGAQPTSNSGAPADGGIVGMAQNANVNNQTTIHDPVNNPNIGTTQNNSSTTVPEGSAPTVIRQDPALPSIPSSSASNIATNVVVAVGEAGGAGGTTVTTNNPNFTGSQQNRDDGVPTTISGTVPEGARPEPGTLTNVSEGTNASTVVGQLPSSSSGASEPALNNPKNNNVLGPSIPVGGVVFVTNVATVPGAPVTTTGGDLLADRVALPTKSELGGGRPINTVTSSNGDLVGLGGGDAVVNESITGGGSGRTEIIFAPPFNPNNLGTPSGTGTQTNIPDGVLQIIFEEEGGQ